MVEPVAFGFNEETAANNYFQQRTVAAGETVQACALKDFGAWWISCVQTA